jgi:hypothetical protein
MHRASYPGNSARLHLASFSSQPSGACAKAETRAAGAEKRLHPTQHNLQQEMKMSTKDHNDTVAANTASTVTINSALHYPNLSIA